MHKSQLKTRVIAALKGLVLLSSLQVVAAAAENLVPNGGFERVTAEGKPYGAYLAKRDGVSFTVTTNAYSGRYSALYVNPNQGGCVDIGGIHVKPSTWYRFSYRVATDVDPVMESAILAKPPPGVYAQIFPVLPPTWRGAMPPIAKPLLYAGGGTMDWSLQRLYFKSDSVWTNLEVSLYINQVSGSARFDDLEIVEATEAEAAAWPTSDAGNVPDGENLLFNGSFELASNDDMPNYIFTGIGAPWFSDRWTMRRLGSADAPDGGHYLHAPYYMSYQTSTDPNRDVTASFFARADRPGTCVSLEFDNVKRSDYVQGAPVFRLTEKWMRYSTLLPRGKGGRLRIVPKDPSDTFDVDGVMLAYGTNLTPFVCHRDEKFFASLEVRRKAEGEKANAACAGKAFDGPLVVPEPKKDGRIDFRFDTVFAGEGLTVRGNIAEASRKLVITNGLGAVAWQGVVTAEALAKGVTVAEDLICGEYALVGTKWGFRVIPAASKWCRVDRFAHMAFTEKGPFLPCGFELLAGTTNYERIPEIAAAGFNTVVLQSVGTNSRDRASAYDVRLARRVLDRLAQCGLEVVAATPDIPPAREQKLFRDPSVKKMFGWQTRNTPYEACVAGKVDYINALKDHPAVRIWQHYDEMYGYWERGAYPKKESQIGDSYRAFRAADPCRLHWNNSTYAGRLYGGAESTDMASATIYTIRYTGGAMNTVANGETLAQVGEKLGGKPGMAGIWLQFYARDDIAGDFGREPSAEELETMLYGCVIKGIRGLWFYSMRPRSNRLWFRGGELAREIASLAPVFALGRELPFAATHPDLMGTCREENGTLTVITCNGAYYDATGKINLPAAYKRGTAKVLFENREVAFDNWTLKDDWKALSRHVYAIDIEKCMTSACDEDDVLPSVSGLFLGLSCRGLPDGSCGLRC